MNYEEYVQGILDDIREQLQKMLRHAEFLVKNNDASEDFWRGYDDGKAQGLIEAALVIQSIIDGNEKYSDFYNTEVSEKACAHIYKWVKR